MKLKYFIVITLLVTCGCASQQSSLLTGKTLEGTPICLESDDKIPAIVKKFFNQRDLTTEEGKIDYLIERVRDSKLVFIRNKVEYDSPSAASFLRWKLNRWRKKGTKIDTAQDFIKLVTSGSAMSGQPYAVVLQDGTRHNLQPVLQNELNALEYCLKQYSPESSASVADSAQLSSAPAGANATSSTT